MQTRWMSLMESVANVVFGYVVAVIAQILVFPLFGMHPTLWQNLWIGMIFTVASLTRSYLLRRVFETHWLRQTAPQVAPERS